MHLPSGVWRRIKEDELVFSLVGISTIRATIQPFGHNRHRPKTGGLLCPFPSGWEVPLLTQCGLDRGLPPYQVKSWSTVTPTLHTDRRDRQDNGPLAYRVNRTVTCKTVAQNGCWKGSGSNSEAQREVKASSFWPTQHTGSQRKARVVSRYTNKAHFFCGPWPSARHDRSQYTVHTIYFNREYRVFINKPGFDLSLF